MRILIIVLVCLVFYACSFNAKVPQTGIAFLQGSWMEDSIENQQQLVNYQQYKFKFTCDSFYLNIKSFSKINLQGGECYNSNTWEEYVKGVYTYKQDSIFLNGAFVTKNYKFKPESACYRFGKYEEKFLIQQLNSTNITFINTSSKQKHSLVLKEKTVCNNAN